MPTNHRDFVQQNRNGERKVASATTSLVKTSKQLLLNATPIEAVKLHLLGSRQQKVERRRLKATIVTQALRVQQEIAEAAAEAGQLAIDCEYQVARDKRLIAHRTNVSSAQAEADEAMARGLISMMVDKQQQLDRLAHLQADPTLAEEAAEYLQELYLCGAQELIDRNRQVRRPK